MATPRVVRALRGDLGRRFGEDFHVIGESSAAAGLAVLRDLADRHEPVARGKPDRPKRQRG